MVGVLTDPATMALAVAKAALAKVADCLAEKGLDVVEVVAVPGVGFVDPVNKAWLARFLTRHNLLIRDSVVKHQLTLILIIRLAAHVISCKTLVVHLQSCLTTLAPHACPRSATNGNQMSIGSRTRNWLIKTSHNQADCSQRSAFFYLPCDCQSAPGKAAVGNLKTRRLW